MRHSHALVPALLLSASATVLAQPVDQTESGPKVSIGPGGLEVTSADGRFSLDLGGRLHLDWWRHFSADPPAEAVDGTEVRRARIVVSGRFDEAWSYIAETDFAGNDVSIKDFALGYELREGLTFTVGHQKQPYSLAVEMSSNDLPFVERAIDNALILPFVDRAIGARVDASRERWFAAAGVYGDSIDDQNEGWGTAGRFVFAPFADERRVLHLGVRAAYREPDTADVIRMRDETTNFSDLHVVDTTPIPQVQSVTLFGPEAAYANGPFAVTAEYNVGRFDRATLGNLDFRSWHVDATWSLSGESRAAAYRLQSGEFKQLRPARSFERGEGGGAWELAARYASIDLNDGGVTGGSEETISLSANWYANRNVRVLLDWTHILDTDESNLVRVAADGLNVVTLRAQYAF